MRLVRKKDSSEPNMAANGAYAKYFTLYKELYRNPVSKRLLRDFEKNI